MKDSVEIEKHQERVQHQKVIDENKIKKLEKEKLKKELGDEYLSSQSDEIWDQDSLIVDEKAIVNWVEPED